MARPWREKTHGDERSRHVTLIHAPRRIWVACEFDVSRERARQIEVRAFEKVQEAVKKNLNQIEDASRI